MLRVLMIGAAVTIAFAAPAAAQQRVTVEKALAQLYGLCDRDYKPACIKLGIVISKIPPRDAQKLKADHPEWWWWEKW